MVLLSAHIKRFCVSCMWDFFSLLPAYRGVPLSFFGVLAWVCLDWCSASSSSVSSGVVARTSSLSLVDSITASILLPLSVPFSLTSPSLLTEIPLRATSRVPIFESRPARPSRSPLSPLWSDSPHPDRIRFLSLLLLSNTSIRSLCVLCSSYFRVIDSSQAEMVVGSLVVCQHSI